jgi:peptidoglycan/LPS O-acetylase OafA/YrhL
MISRPFYISPFQSDLLDLSRWLAAFLVVIEHLRSLMFADYGTQGGMGVVGKIFYFLTGFGHSAVMVFFVMSGFLVGGKVLERLAQGNFSWQKYGVDRISRLYAVYVLALLLGGALDYVGYHHFNQFGLYDQTFSGQIAVINHNFHQNLSAPVFAVNLAMCQTILGPVFGSNGPLWSLANEFWYYLAAPVLFLLIYKKKIGVRTLGAAGLAGIVWFLPSSILIYSVVWLLGAALYFFNERRLLPLWFSLGLFAACFSAGRMQWISTPFAADFLIGISFALVINSAAGFSQRLVGKNLSRSLAGFSYSVYLCHFPFLALALSILFQTGVIGFRGRPTLPLAAIFLVVLLAVYLWSYIVSLGTERQTPRIRAWLNRCLPRAGLD